MTVGGTTPSKVEHPKSNCGSQPPHEPALVREPTPLLANPQQQAYPQDEQQQQQQLGLMPNHHYIMPHGFTATPLVTPLAAPLQSPPSPNQQLQQQPQQLEHEEDEDDNEDNVTINRKKKRGVPHIYHDYCTVQDTMGFVRKKTGGVTQAFPEKLMDMLTAESDNQTLVGWLPHGRAFIVRKPKQFTDEIMPKYFRQSKLTSFQRQLNLYGFRRLTQGADAGAYYHELFLRGRPQLCQRMNRQKVKGTGHKQPADAQTEPNFYVMPTAPEPTYIAHASSGIQGLQGAADLLKGFASSMPVTNLSGTTWPAPIQMTAPAPGVHHQYIYNAVSAQNTHQQQQTQVVYTQGPNGQPQMQQIIYAPAQTQASVTLGSDGQYYLTTTPTYTLPNPTTTHPGEQLQQQQYTSAPGASMISYAPQDNSAYSSAPTIQFVWPQQLQQQQQSWIQQAQQIQQISQPGSSSQLDQGTQQQQQQQQQQTS